MNHDVNFFCDPRIEKAKKIQSDRCQNFKPKLAMRIHFFVILFVGYKNCKLFSLTIILRISAGKERLSALSNLK